MTNSQAVLLGKGVDAKGNVIKVVGQYFYRQYPASVAIPIEAVLEARMLRVPTYLLGEGKITAVQTAQAEGDVSLVFKDRIWNECYDNNAEQLTLLDRNGILGLTGQLYAVSTQNVAFFSNDYQRIRRAVIRNKLVGGALQLEQNEVDTFLEAVKDSNPTKIFSDNGWVTGGSEVSVFGVNNNLFDSDGYQKFVDASDANDFLKNMPAYVLVQPVEQAQKEVLDGSHLISQQRENKNLIVHFGGREQLGKVMDATEALGYTTFFSYRNCFTTVNVGRVVILCSRNSGVFTCINLVGDAYTIGVAPEALVARAKIVGPVPTEPKPLETRVTDETGWLY
jgi:hypothetical protein